MLKITLHDSSRELLFRLEGRLAGLWSGELLQCWRTASSTTEGRRTVVDLADVDFVDAGGRQVLQEMHGAGVEFVAATPLIQTLVQEIRGHGLSAA